MSAFKKLGRLLASLAGREVHSQEVRDALAKASQQLINSSMASPAELLQSLSSGEQGISYQQAEQLLEHFGKNEIAYEKAPPWYRQLIQAFFNPFVGILMLLAAASFLTEYIFAPAGEEDLTAMVIISALVLISVLLTFFQEYQANQAAEKLKAMVTSTAEVKRDGVQQKTDTSQLVPGDLLLLAAGDVVPADVRFITTNNLSLNEATLTGESLPVEKHAETLTDTSPEEANVLELPNIGLMGTNVVSGAATAVVLATGANTYFGSMSRELVGHHPPTSFDKGIGSVSMLLIRFMAVMVPIIFLISGLTRGDWFGALLFGLAVAVGLTPEMLPTIVTANLAKGTLEMAKSKTIIKRLSAIQNLGAMDVLCTDKTGTLTYDAVSLEQHLGLDGEADDSFLSELYLNSQYQTGYRNPLDEAILANDAVRDLAKTTTAFDKVDEVPFETARRKMSVVVRGPEGKHMLICKGAVTEMLDSADNLRIRGKIIAVDKKRRENIKKLTKEITNDGFRVLLLGKREFAVNKECYGPEDETGLTLLGIVGFWDPPKDTAGPAIVAIHNRGVRVVVITGDNEVATRRICREIGFEITGLVHGQETEKMSDEELAAAAEKANVFVRTAPLQKSRILNALKANGHIVGFLGDGINDAPALRDSDVGISVDNAVDIAKESAEIILLEKSLMILEEGIIRGRFVFGNIMKYVKMTVSSNFGNVFSVLVASIFIPFPPMLPLHLLVQNLLYDISQISLPWDTVDEEYITRPQKWNPASITRFTLYVGPVSSIFDLTTFALLWFVFGANTAADQSLFHTGWFVLGLLSQTLVVHIIRTRKIPFIQSTAAKPVMIMTGLVMLIGLGLPFTPLGGALGFVSLPLPYFFWLIATLLAYFGLMQLVKTWYVKRFNQWL